MYNYTADWVKEKLKSPSSAEFPGSREKLAATQHLDSGRYLINSYVESQNSFGAMLKTYFKAIVRHENERVVLESLEFE